MCFSGRVFVVCSYEPFWLGLVLGNYVPTGRGWWYTFMYPSVRWLG
jgi:hypothetical protein